MYFCTGSLTLVRGRLNLLYTNDILREKILFFSGGAPSARGSHRNTRNRLRTFLALLLTQKIMRIDDVVAEIIRLCHETLRLGWGPPSRSEMRPTATTSSILRVSSQKGLISATTSLICIIFCVYNIVRKVLRRLRVFLGLPRAAGAPPEENILFFLLMYRFLNTESKLRPPLLCAHRVRAFYELKIALFFAFGLTVQG